MSWFGWRRPPEVAAPKEWLDARRAAGGVTAAEWAANLQAARRPLTDDERALIRFRARHAGDPPPFARVRP